jgi:hypothetical protein
VSRMFAVSVTGRVSEIELLQEDASKPVAVKINVQDMAMDSLGRLVAVRTGKHDICRLTLRAEGAAAFAQIAGDAKSGYRDHAHNALLARFSAPSGVAIDRADNVYIADQGNQLLRRIDGATGAVSTLPLDVPHPDRVRFDPGGGSGRDGALYVTIGFAGNQRIVAVDVANCAAARAGPGAEVDVGDFTDIRGLELELAAPSAISFLDEPTLTALRCAPPIAMWPPGLAELVERYARPASPATGLFLSDTGARLHRIDLPPCPR